MLVFLFLAVIAAGSVPRAPMSRVAQVRDIETVRTSENATTSASSMAAP